MSQAIGIKESTEETFVGTFGGVTDLAGANGVTEVPIFIAPFDCEIVKAYLIVTTTVAADATNYLTVTLVPKGAAGTGTTAMGTIDFNSAAGNASITRHVPLSFGALTGTAIPRGSCINLHTIHGGTGASMTNATLMIVYLPQAGLVQP